MFGFYMHQHPQAQSMLVLEYEGDKTEHGFCILLLSMHIKDDYYCYIESNDSFFKGVAIYKIDYELISNIE